MPVRSGRRWCGGRRRIGETRSSCCSCCGFSSPREGGHRERWGRALAVGWGARLTGKYAEILRLMTSEKSKPGYVFRGAQETSE